MVPSPLILLWLAQCALLLKKRQHCTVGQAFTDRRTKHKVCKFYWIVYKISHPIDVIDRNECKYFLFDGPLALNFINYGSSPTVMAYSTVHCPKLHWRLHKPIAGVTKGWGGVMGTFLLSLTIKIYLQGILCSFQAKSRYTWNVAPPISRQVKTRLLLKK